MSKVKSERPKAKRKKKATTPKAKIPVVLRPEPLFRKNRDFDERAALENLRRNVFEADAARWEKGERSKEDLLTAFGYWVGYSAFVEMIGHDWRRDDLCLAAYYSLNSAHTLATQVLMEEAERQGLDPHPLYECARVVQELYAHTPAKYRRGMYDTWPECMGLARYSLPAGQQEALRAGEVVFIRLAVKAGIADDRNPSEVTKKTDPSQRPEVRNALQGTGVQYSSPMSLVEMASRLGNMNAKAFKQVASKEYGLTRVSRKIWRVRLDLMDEVTRRKIETGR